MGGGGGGWDCSAFSGFRVRIEVAGLGFRALGAKFKADYYGRKPIALEVLMVFQGFLGTLGLGSNILGPVGIPTLIEHA